MNKARKLDLTRRHFFDHAFGKAAGFGIGSAALASLLGQRLSAETTANHILDFAPKAKRVIYLQQAGGPPHIDLFDYKPELEKRDGQPTPESLIKGERFAFITGTPMLQKSPFAFKQYGNSGRRFRTCCLISPRWWTTSLSSSPCTARSLITVRPRFSK